MDALIVAAEIEDTSTPDVDVANSTFCRALDAVLMNDIDEGAFDSNGGMWISAPAYVEMKKRVRKTFAVCNARDRIRIRTQEEKRVSASLLSLSKATSELRLQRDLYERTRMQMISTGRLINILQAKRR